MSWFSNFVVQELQAKCMNSVKPAITVSNVYKNQTCNFSFVSFRSIGRLHTYCSRTESNFVRISFSRTELFDKWSIQKLIFYSMSKKGRREKNYIFLTKNWQFYGIHYATYIWMLYFLKICLYMSLANWEIRLLQTAQAP